MPAPPDAADRPAGGTALVTGGSGFLGRHLAGLLHARSVAVRVLDPAGRAPDGARAMTGSSLDAPALGRAVAGVDTVYHLAALSRPGMASEAAYRRVNAEG